MKVFISCVTSEFGECRQKIATDLRLHGADVKIQEDFNQEPTTLLAKLERYISECDCVIILLGQHFGWGQDDETGRSFSHWEYYFTCGERLSGTKTSPKPYLLYVPSNAYTTPSGSDSILQTRTQSDFYSEVMATHHDFSNFCSSDNVARKIVYDVNDFAGKNGFDFQISSKDLSKYWAARSASQISDIERLLDAQFYEITAKVATYSYLRVERCNFTVLSSPNALLVANARLIDKETPTHLIRFLHALRHFAKCCGKDSLYELITAQMAQLIASIDATGVPYEKLVDQYLRICPALALSEQSVPKSYIAIGVGLANVECFLCWGSWDRKLELEHEHNRTRSKAKTLQAQVRECVGEVESSNPMFKIDRIEVMFRSRMLVDYVGNPAKRISWLAVNYPSIVRTLDGALLEPSADPNQSLTTDRLTLCTAEEGTINPKLHTGQVLLREPDPVTVKACSELSRLLDEPITMLWLHERDEACHKDLESLIGPGASIGDLHRLVHEWRMMKRETRSKTALLCTYKGTSMPAFCLSASNSLSPELLNARL